MIDLEKLKKLENPGDIYLKFEKIGSLAELIQALEEAQKIMQNTDKLTLDSQQKAKEVWLSKYFSKGDEE